MPCQYRGEAGEAMKGVLISRLAVGVTQRSYENDR